MAAQTLGIEDTFAKMVEEFKTSLLDSANTLKLLHDKLSAGLLPDEELAGRAARSLDGDRKEYQKLHEACTDLLGGAAPAFGASADELLGAVRAKAERERTALAKSRQLLARFLAVKADSSLHAKGLQPWRDKARAIQNQLDARALTPDGMAEQVRPFELFLRAASLADRDGEATERVFDELEEFFEPRITRGLYGGKYRVPAAEALDAASPATGEAPATEAGRPAPAEPGADKAPAGLADKAEQDAQAPRDAQDLQGPQDPKDPKDSQGPQGSQCPQGPQVSQDPQAPRDVQPVQAVHVSQDAQGPAENRRGRRSAAAKEAAPGHSADAGQEQPEAEALPKAPERSPAARTVRGRRPKPRSQSLQGSLMSLAAMEKANAPKADALPKANAPKAGAGTGQDASEDASPSKDAGEDARDDASSDGTPAASGEAQPFAAQTQAEPSGAPDGGSASGEESVSASEQEEGGAGQEGCATARDAGASALQRFDLDEEEPEEDDLPLYPESDEVVDTRPRVRGFELARFLNSNAKKHYGMFIQTLSLVGIATADQLLRFAQLYGALNPKHAKKAMGELRILASNGYVKAVRGQVPAFVLPDSSVCALYACERRSDFPSTIGGFTVPEFCCRRSVSDSMPQSRVAIAVDLNERLLRYFEGVRPHLHERRWPIFLSSTVYCNYRVEAECYYDSPPELCWIAWPGAPIDEKPRKWLFVPSSEEGLPQLANPAFGSACYAFWEDAMWKWRNGAWERDADPWPDDTPGQSGKTAAARGAAQALPPEAGAAEKAEKGASAQAGVQEALQEKGSASQNAGRDKADPLPDEPLEPESGETVSLAPRRSSRQLSQFLRSNSTRQYQSILFVMAIFGIATMDQILRYCTLHGLLKEPSKARRDIGILAASGFVKVVGEGAGKACAYPGGFWNAHDMGAGGTGMTLRTGWQRILPDSVPQSRIDLILALNERFLCLMEQAKPLLGASRFSEFFEQAGLFTFRIEAPAFFQGAFVPCRIALPDTPVDKAAASWLFVPTAEEGLPGISAVAEGGACYAFFDKAWWKWDAGAWIKDPGDAPPSPDGTRGRSGSASGTKGRKASGNAPEASGTSGSKAEAAGRAASAGTDNAAAKTASDAKAAKTASDAKAAKTASDAKAAKTASDAKQAKSAASDAKDAGDAPAPRKRGRPRKKAPAEAEAKAAGAEAAAQQPSPADAQPCQGPEADRQKAGGKARPAASAKPGAGKGSVASMADFLDKVKPAASLAEPESPCGTPPRLDSCPSRGQPADGEAHGPLAASPAPAGTNKAPSAGNAGDPCPRTADEAPWQTAARLAACRETPADEELCSLVERLCARAPSDGADMLASPSLAQALALAEACRLQKLPLCGELALRLQLATGTAAPEDYGSFSLANAFPPEPRLESLALAAYLRALAVSAGDGQDYRLLDRAHLYLNDFDQAFPSYRSLRPLFARLVETRQAEPSGFTPKALAQIEDEEAKSASLEALRRRARELTAVPAVKMRAHGIPEMLQALFGRTSELGACMEACAQDKPGAVALVKRVLEAFCDASGEGWKPREKDLAEAVESAWSQATKNMSTRRFSLFHDLRQSVQDEVEARLEVMAEWLAGAEAMDSGRAERLRGFKYQVLKELDALPERAGGSDAFACCVDFMLALLRDLLRQRRQPKLFADLLRTGYVSLDSHFRPVFWEETAQIRWFEPWRRVLKHIARPEATLAKALADISAEPASPVFDNLNQLALIERLQGTAEGGQAFDDSARRHAEAGTEEFKARLELDYAAGRVDEADKEDLLQIISSMQERFFALGDFGCWRQLLEAAELERTERIAARKARLAREIDSLRQEGSGPATALDKACRELEQGQFSMAEEFLNVFDLRSRERLEALCNPDMEDAGYYQRFLSPSFFEPAYEYCMRSLKGSGLGKRAIDFLNRLAADPDEWTSRYKEDSRLFLQSWPAQGGAKADRLVAFLEGLGIQTRRASLQDRFPSEEIWEAEVSPTPASHPDYPHPIAAFGTRLQSPLRVVVMYGSRTAKALVDTVNALKLQGRFMTMVVLDYALSKDVRCQLAEACHKSSGLSPFIVVDWMLALYLALHQKTERMAALLSCALPYATAVQPFVRDGGPTAEEMFCGRTRELNDILDFGGACLVYGGRQLGKTALLQRAQSRFHAPESRCYAVYCSIKDKAREADVVPFLCQEVNKQTDLRIPLASTLATFCGSLENLFRRQKIQSMLLLVDEADNFLREAGLADYQPLQPLADLKRRLPSFKFVLAGLNNVCRARNATSNNGVFGQLGQPLCIKPLSPAEAMRLVLRPLRYLGFTPGPDSHLDTILSSTNYYPGIVQFFGYKLVQSLNEDYSRYYRASEGNPPFPLKGEHLGAIMNNSDMNESIRQKFRLSLELDERYFMLARCICMLYLLQESMDQGFLGYGADQIRTMAEDYGIRCLAGLGTAEYEVLLDEMTEMGILHHAPGRGYRLRKRSFLDIIGQDMDRLDAEIAEENARSRQP